MFQEQITAIEERDLTIKEAIADRAYGAAENLVYLDEKEIKHSIPLFRSVIGRKQEGFRYSKKSDVYICPRNHKLHPGKKDREAVFYTLSQTTCRNCPISSSCLPKREIFRSARISRHKHQDVYDRVLKRETGEDFKNKLHERMWSMEGLFAEAKTFHGLDRARYRGRWKVQAQVYLVSAMQNLKRLMAASFYDLINFLFNGFIPEISRENPELILAFSR